MGPQDYESLRILYLRCARAWHTEMLADLQRLKKTIQDQRADTQALSENLSNRVQALGGMRLKSLRRRRAADLAAKISQDRRMLKEMSGRLKANAAKVRELLHTVQALVDAGRAADSQLLRAAAKKTALSPEGQLKLRRIDRFLRANRDVDATLRPALIALGSGICEAFSTPGTPDADASLLKSEHDKKPGRRTRPAPAFMSDQINLPIHPAAAEHPDFAGTTRDPQDGSVRISRERLELGVPDKLYAALPLVLRNEPLVLNFAPARDNVPLRNIAGFFSGDDWVQVVRRLRTRAGSRCMVCGGVGGLLPGLAGKPSDPGEVRTHAVWEWLIPDETSGVGIQRLKDLLMVCVDCHLMFREDAALLMTDDTSLRAEIREHIRTRIAQVTGLGRDAVDRLLQSERSADAARQKGAEGWIVDVSLLAERQLLGPDYPTLNSDGGVSPSTVAGVMFQDDDGNVYTARDAVEAYNDLVSELTLLIEKEIRAAAKGADPTTGFGQR